MSKITSYSFENQPLFRSFIHVKDPRVPGRCLHPLITIIVITICAMICGANTWEEIELFAREREHWLERHVDLPHGVPSQLTFARVFSLLDPNQLQECFMYWAREIVRLFAGDLIAIDGKTLRGSSHINGNKKQDHIINAFAVREKITLGQVKTPDKSNEIKGIPILLKKLAIAGATISIDAMGTQRGIANLIRKKQAHYVLALKQNHKRFYRKVSRLFEQADALKYQNMMYQQYQELDYDHGRLETREYTVLPSMYLPKYQSQWRNLSLFVRVKSIRDTVKGREESVRYYISSLPYKHYRQATNAVRQHWSIENTLHWKLDVGLHEDQCQIYRGHAAENLSVLRKCVLYLLQQEKSSTHGIQIKRMHAALSARYLRKVVGF